MKMPQSRTKFTAPQQPAVANMGILFRWMRSQIRILRSRALMMSMMLTEITMMIMIAEVRE